MHIGLRLTCAIALALGTLPSPAFDPGGHFFTAQALVDTASAQLPSAAERRLIAFCTQLPDMAEELPATSVYLNLAVGSPWAWARWALSDITTAPAVSTMVTVQHLLHALTGGSPAAVQAVASRSTESLWAEVQARTSTSRAQRNAALCALGFSLHFLADAHAHVQMNNPLGQASAPAMYETGLGHFRDAHYPDHVFCTEFEAMGPAGTACRFNATAARFLAWQTLWGGSAATPFDPDPSRVDAARRNRLMQAVVSAGGSAGHWMGDTAERAMRDALLQAAEQTHEPTDTEKQYLRSLHDFILEETGPSRSCDVVLADALQQPVLRELESVSCAEVWDLYQVHVRQAYKTPGALPDARKGLRSGRAFEDIYCDAQVFGRKSRIRDCPPATTS